MDGAGLRWGARACASRQRKTESGLRMTGQKRSSAAETGLGGCAMMEHPAQANDALFRPARLPAHSKSTPTQRFMWTLWSWTFSVPFSSRDPEAGTFFLQQVSELADSVRNKSPKSWLNGEFFCHCSSCVCNGKS